MPAFTALKRFVALKILEARQTGVGSCINKGEQSAGSSEILGDGPRAVALLPRRRGLSSSYVRACSTNFPPDDEALF